VWQIVGGDMVEWKKQHERVQKLSHRVRAFAVALL
jgi:hypothetical protein